MRKIKLIFKQLFSSSKEKRQRHKNISRIKEYFSDNPVEWSPVRMFINEEGAVDRSEAGYNKDENFKILNTDWEEIKKAVALEGNKDSRYLYASEDQWKKEILFNNKLT